MARQVALLRGINLGKRQMKMPALRDVFAAAGCTEVQTYVASGNVVFVDGRGSSGDLVAEIEARIADEFGFQVDIVLRTASEMASVVERNPFPVDDPTKVVVTFLRAEWPADALAPIDPATFLPEAAHLDGCELYLHLPNGQARAKLPAAIDKLRLGGVATTRNWRTVVTLAEMAEGS